MDPIESLSVSLDSVSPPLGYSLAVQLPNRVCIWVRRGRRDPIRALKLDLFAIDDSNYEYGACPVSLSGSDSNMPIFLTYSSCVQGSPILDIKYIHCADPIQRGWNIVDEQIPTYPPVFLVYTTIADQGVGEMTLRVGEFVDALDSQPMWCMAIVKAKHEHEVAVRYYGWSEKFDEKIDLRSGRIAPFRTNTFYNTGAKPKYLRSCEIELDELAANEAILHAALSKDQSIEKKGDLEKAFNYVENLLCAV
jgi:hypothetical protein